MLDDGFTSFMLRVIQLLLDEEANQKAPRFSMVNWVWTLTINQPQ